jgi:hypothetical protein
LTPAIRATRAPVGGDDQAPAQGATRALAILDHDSGTAGAVAQQLRRGAARQQLDARRRGGHAAQERIEDLARDVVAVRQVAALADPATVGRPQVDRVAHRAALLDERRQPQLLDRRRRAGLDVVRADGLVRVEVRAPLDERHARAALREQARRGAAGDARPDDDRVEVRPGHQRRLSIRACRRCRRTIAFSARLPGEGTMAS